MWFRVGGRGVFGGIGQNSRGIVFLRFGVGWREFLFWVWRGGGYGSRFCFCRRLG